ncbi:winged helix-turn-helix transcriptional regulator [Sporolactobacillus laevolacticus]|uniref:winged helix-turn-helix transcriptional regulator n=1 Tax=Sporolactobacillus laevolacticus TaxID=33018 RepID=UPI0025B525D5|nr:helix-turn-helix domain-containing protein [Sporolactobacillus laevolacticus]MDF2909891.1 MarR family transcriptional regulator [Sporolactobacillus laevolacticus]MDN3956393.1 helix-turn-helix domain-containing protein [Sporolactobacillus laevolacticus]
MFTKLTRDSSQNCPIEASLNLIGTKWSFLIIRELMIDGTLRYNQILKNLEGISPRTLSAKLKLLEESKIISKKVYAEVPPRVEYSLTDFGKKLEPIFLELKKFGITLQK